MRNIGQLETLLPQGPRVFLSKATELGFIPVLVGGAVRDFFLDKSDITDWDFELHHPEGNDGIWSKLLHSLKADFNLAPQPHGVIKATLRGQKNEFEFALPRLETFPQKETYSHSDFTSKVVFQCSFEEACKRRDFTLNAIGAAFEKGEWKLWDPLHGLKALKANTLHPCSPEDFGKDPVRWLRAQRFSVKFGFHFSAELTQIMEGMDLEQITAHYIAEESNKSRRPFIFWNRLQLNESLPARFHGGLAHPEEMEKLYQQFRDQLGFSNALLTGVFYTNEGWHLLLPLGGKGEKEISLWRERRELIRQLSGKKPESFEGDTEAFEMLCRLTKTPFQWPKEEWVRITLETHGLEWIGSRAWPELDLKDVAPLERHRTKVKAWLQ